MASLHDKILSCDELSTKTLPQLQKMKKFYEIKEAELEKSNSFHKYRIWLVKNPKKYLGLSILSFIILIFSVILVKVSIYFLLLSLFSSFYIILVTFLLIDDRSIAIDKNKATIGFMIKTYNQKPKGKEVVWKFRKKAQMVYDILKEKERNFSGLLKEVRKKESKCDKNTLKNILEQDLSEVVSVEKGSISTSSRDLSSTNIYKIKM